MVAVVRRVVVRGVALRVDPVDPVDPVEQMRLRMGRLHALMDEWVVWCRRDVPRVGFPSHSALIIGAAGCPQERAVSARAELVDAVVEDLVPIHRAAVMRRYGVAAVWRFPRDNYAVVLEAALLALIVGLRRKGVDMDV